MFDTVLGLPVHPLVVHAVVVLAPVAALLIVLFAVSARFRAWSGVLTPVVATLAFAAAPVATRSGEALRERLGGGGDLVADHAGLGEVLPWVLLAGAVVAWLMWWSWRRDRSAADARGAAVAASGVSRALAVVGVLVALGMAVDVALVGHSGSRAVWEGIGSQPAPGDG